MYWCGEPPGRRAGRQLQYTGHRREEATNCVTMLAAGRSFPAATAARRAATTRSTSHAQRSSVIFIRTLSSEGTPGTVAGARAAASAGRREARASAACLSLLLCVCVRRWANRVMFNVLHGAHVYLFLGIKRQEVGMVPNAAFSTSNRPCCMFANGDEIGRL